MLDLAPHEVVRDLKDLCFDHWEDGIKVRDHLSHGVLYQSHGWALLLVGFRLRNHGRWYPPEYRLVRMRRLAGAWRVYSHLPMRLHHLQGLFQKGPEIITEAITRGHERESH